jgi:hypothetical protein
MALEILLQKTGINSDGTKITIDDITGAYNASTNTTGYGTPNAARNSLALFVRAFAERYDNTDDIVETNLTVTPADADPVTVESWDVTLLETDSWIMAKVYGLQLYDLDLSFEVGELVYDVDSGEIRKILTKSGDGPYVYTYDVVEESALDSDSTVKAYTTILNTYDIPNACECANTANELYFADREKDEVKFRKYLEISGLITSIKNDFGFGNYSEGQKTIEYLENICDCLTEDCNC